MKQTPLKSSGWCPRCSRDRKVPDGMCPECGCPLQHPLAKNRERPWPSQRKPLKTGRRKRRPSLAGFHEAVCADGSCALEYRGGCGGKLDAHHVYPAQRIRRNVVPELRDQAVQDPRNGLSVCRDHHAAIEARVIPCPTPPFYAEFLADYGLHDDQHYEQEGQAA